MFAINIYYPKEGKIMAKRLKITPQGYLVIAATAILLIAIIVIICVVSCNGCNNEAEVDPSAGNTTLQPSLGTAEPQQSPQVPPPTSPETPTSKAPTGSENPPATAPATATQPPPATPDMSKVYTEPTSKMKKESVNGKLQKDGVRMRQGPGTNYKILKEDIKEGSSVTVYAEQEGWYFLKLIAVNEYGYIRKDMVKLEKALGAEEAAPTKEPEAPEGTIKGKITASVLVLRKTPERLDNNKLGDYKKGQIVFIHHKVKDSEGNLYYYVTIAGTKTKGYLCVTEAGKTSKMISAEGNVPDK